jgi:hypothetical protein
VFRDPNAGAVTSCAAFHQEVPGLLVVNVNTYSRQDLQRCRMNLFAFLLTQTAVVSTGHRQTVGFDHGITRKLTYEVNELTHRFYHAIYQVSTHSLACPLVIISDLRFKGISIENRCRSWYDYGVDGD